MKPFSHLPIIRGLAYLLILTLFFSCKKEYHSTNPSQSPELFSGSNGGDLSETGATQSQTATATLFNYNLEGNLVTNFSKKSKASDVAFNDGVYASTIKLGPRDGYSLLVLEGFGFNIPGNAIIENIYVKARRFKTGTCGIWETNAALVMKRERQDLPDWWERYGARWVDPNYFPLIETEVNYSQSGSGTGANGQPYQWTPARVNDPYFGVMFQTAAVEKSKGFAVINYDFIEITVEYSLS
jgi:hypothetical protein